MIMVTLLIRMTIKTMFAGVIQRIVLDISYRVMKGISINLIKGSYKKNEQKRYFTR